MRLALAAQQAGNIAASEGDALSNVFTIPPALALIFPEGVVPWAPVPDIGPTPTVATVTASSDVRQNLEIYSYETVFGDGLAYAMFSSFDMVLLENHGTLWNQSAASSATIVSGGNWEAVVNNGTMVAISGDGNATGFFSGSWGILQNYGELYAISYSGGAVGYVSWSPGSWSREREQINEGTIHAWSGAAHAVAVDLVNAGTFTNTGTLLATGYLGAVGISFSTHEGELDNSGTIEAVSSANGVSVGILHDWNGNLVINNSGVIRADYAILAELYYTPGHTVTNTGLIEGHIILYDGIDTITNSGTIVGDIIMMDEADFYDGRLGTLVGILDLGNADDVAYGGANNDFIIGGRGNDRIEGGRGNDHLDGGFGNDYLDGAAGTDTAYYDTAQIGVTVNLNTAAAQNTIGAGIDTLISIENLYASNFADTITGNAGNNTVYGYGGNDVIRGLAGNDRLYGEDGNDTLRGEDGDDKLYGGAGADMLVGGDGVDELEGGSGADTLFGGLGNDLLTGGAENDTLRGEDGDDTLRGDAGDDLLVGGRGVDTVHAGEGNDKVYAGQGNDLVYGEAGDDNLRGEAGIDVIHGGEGSDAILAGADNDTVYGDAGSDRIYGEGGNDLMYGGTENDALRGGAGDDIAYGGTGSDILIGDAGNDQLFGEDGPDKFFGGDGDDVLIGAEGNDVMRGDAGNDTLSAGAGSDTLLGGTGADQFIVQASGGADMDRIKDFEQGLDVIRLEGSGFADFAALQGAMAVLGAHTVITLASGDRLIIDNILPGDLTAADFEFAAGAEPQTGGKAQVGETQDWPAGFAFERFDLSGLVHTQAPQLFLDDIAHVPEREMPDLVREFSPASLMDAWDSDESFTFSDGWDGV